MGFQALAKQTPWRGGPSLPLSFDFLRGAVILFGIAENHYACKKRTSQLIKIS
jgi:hypothetical protein